jgi:hypothetical protein
MSTAECGSGRIPYANCSGRPLPDDPTCSFGPLIIDGGTCCGTPPACGNALASSLAFTLRARDDISHRGDEHQPQQANDFQMNLPI